MIAELEAQGLRGRALAEALARELACSVEKAEEIIGIEHGADDVVTLDDID